MGWLRRSPALSVLLALTLVGSTAMVTALASGSTRRQRR